MNTAHDENPYPDGSWVLTRYPLRDLSGHKSPHTPCWSWLLGHVVHRVDATSWWLIVKDRRVATDYDGDPAQADLRPWLVQWPSVFRFDHEIRPLPDTDVDEDLDEPASTSGHCPECLYPTEDQAAEAATAAGRGDDQLAAAAGPAGPAGAPTTEDRQQPSATGLGSADKCLKPSTTGTCVQSLAGGWITVLDLCARCTTRLIAGLEWAADRDEWLDWHPSYVERQRSPQSLPRSTWDGPIH